MGDDHPYSCIAFYYMLPHNRCPNVTSCTAFFYKIIMYLHMDISIHKIRNIRIYSHFHELIVDYA